MRNVNTVILIGNVTRDPEIKKLLKGETIATFGLATNREWTTTAGNDERSTEFHEIVCFAGLANVTELRVKKGMLVHIVGHLKTRSWDDADGLKRFRTEVVADELIVLTKREPSPDYDGNRSNAHQEPAHTPAAESQPMSTEESPAITSDVFAS